MALLITLTNLQFQQRRGSENSKHCNTSKKIPMLFLLHIPIPVYRRWPYSWNTEGKAALDFHSSGLWNIVRLLGFFRFIHKFCSDIFGHAPKQPEPPHLPAWTSQAPCMATCPSELLIVTAPGKAGTFPQHPGADALTCGWRSAPSLSENFLGKGFLAVLFQTEYICYSCTIALDDVLSLVYGPGQPWWLPVMCLVSWNMAPTFWRWMESGRAVPLQAMAAWSLIKDGTRERWWAFVGVLLWES